MSEKFKGAIAVFEAPNDSEEKKTWAYHMMRIQFAMWVDDGAKCVHCGKPYTSTDDMINRKPRAVNVENFDEMFCDDKCFETFKKTEKGKNLLAQAEARYNSCNKTNKKED